MPIIRFHGTSVFWGNSKVKKAGVATAEYLVIFKSSLDLDFHDGSTYSCFNIDAIFNMDTTTSYSYTEASITTTLAAEATGSITQVFGFEVYSAHASTGQSPIDRFPDGLDSENREGADSHVSCSAISRPSISIPASIVEFPLDNSSKTYTYAAAS